MRARVAAAVAVAVAVALPALVATAGSAKINNAKQHYKLTLSDAWTVVDIDANDEGRLAGFTADGGAIAAVTRVSYPNIDARRRKTKKAFFALVEKGVEQSATAYERLHRKQSTSGSVPFLDITYRHERADGTKEVVFLRFLFHRTYSLSLVVTIPDEAYKAGRRAHNKLITSFKPYWGK